MKEIFQKNWLSLSIRGLIILIFGTFLLIYPDYSREDMMLYLGIAMLALALIYGSVSIARRKENRYWGFLLAFGLADLGIGLFAVINSAAATLYFNFIIGIWGAILGLVLLFLGIKSEKFKFILILNGLVSIAFGVLILLNPFTEAGTIESIVSIYTLLLGIFVIYAGWQMRTLHKRKELAIVRKHVQDAAREIEKTLAKEKKAGQEGGETNPIHPEGPEV